MNQREIFKMLIAVPAVAGLMFVAGCDQGDDTTDGVNTTGGSGAMETGDTAGSTVEGVMDEPDPTLSSGLEGVTGAATEQIEQPLAQLEDALDSAEAEATAGTEGALDQAREVVQNIRQAIEDGDMTELQQHVTQLQGLRAQLPASVQQRIDQLVQAVPGVSGLQGGLGGQGGGAGTTPPATGDN